MRTVIAPGSSSFPGTYQGINQFVRFPGRIP